MKCEQIQELLLTDYLDGQLDGEGLKSIEQHLSDCPGCREFLAVARKITVEPFYSSKKVFLSQEDVWHRIKQQIEKEHSQPSLSHRLAEMILGLKELVPKPAWALSIMVAGVILTAVYFNSWNRQEMVQTASSEDNGQYIAYFTDDVGSGQPEDNGGYGTAIEEYFL